MCINLLGNLYKNSSTSRKTDSFSFDSFITIVTLICVKIKIDNIFCLCGKVSQIFLKPVTEVDGKISKNKDYGQAFNYFHELLNAVSSLSHEIWGGKKPLENELAVAFLEFDINPDYPKGFETFKMPYISDRVDGW